MGPDAASPGGGRTPTILVVDDDPDILETLRTFYSYGLVDVRVLTANSGAEALAILEVERVDLVVSDYKMPGMTGIELLGRAREMSPGLPTILVTAFGGVTLTEQAVGSAGIDRLFRKPLDPSLHPSALLPSSFSA